MVAVMAGIKPDVEASCAICGAPPFPECPHEGERLAIALDQAVTRWDGVQVIRDWVLNHARNEIMYTFQQLRAARFDRMQAYLATLPCYSLYQNWNGAPPISPVQMQQLHHQIATAQQAYTAGVDEDWRRSCLRYPEVLDYFFSLVEISLPSDRDPAVQEPRIGATLPRAKVKGARDGGSGARKRERRQRSRERTPPLPAAPMPRAHGRR